MTDEAMIRDALKRIEDKVDKWPATCDTHRSNIHGRINALIILMLTTALTAVGALVIQLLERF